LISLAGDVTLPIAIALIGLGGSVVVALTTLAGIWITMANERKRERQRREWDWERWRSDLKLESYADLIRAADDFRKAATDLRTAEPSEQASFAQKFEEQSHLLDRAASRVNFVGSADLQPPLHALVLQGLTTISNIVYGLTDAPDADWQEALDRYFRLYDELMNAARDDLGLEPIVRPIELPTSE
jgi:hypothetical protein